MKAYQKKEQEVNKKTINVVDADRLIEIAGESLDAMIYQVGIEAMMQILEQDVEEIVGPKGRHNKGRTASRHGAEQTKVVFNDRKVAIMKPRVRSNGHDLQLPSLPYFQNEDCLNRSVLTRLICGLSTRKYQRTVGGDEDNACTSKSDVSRRYKAEIGKLVAEFFSRRLDDMYPIIMIDGMDRGGMTVISAIGINCDGKKTVLGLVEGGSENSQSVKYLLDDMISRGLCINERRLFVLDGSKALYKAVRDVFGAAAEIQRCQVHKKRNVLSHLPQSEQANIGLAISKAYMEFNYETALTQLELIADNLESRYPSAAASMREGLHETLTVNRLKVPGLLRKSLSSTNIMEAANSIASSVVRRISKWKNGDMLLRNMAAGFLEAERGFRRVQGYKSIQNLIFALQNTVNIGHISNMHKAVV